MKVKIRVFEKVVELDGDVKIDGCSFTVNGTEIFRFDKYESGYCETCFYTESGITFVNKEIAEQLGQEHWIAIATSHLNVEINA